MKFYLCFTDYVEQSFCMKTPSRFIVDWPSGRYCVYKKGDCPKNMKQGTIFWDDEDANNTNSGKPRLTL